MLSLDAEEKRTLRYSDGLRHDFKLLQIEPEMLDELKDGRVAFKGLPNDPGHHSEAVLCTSNRTYEVREVETTNLVMMVDEAGVENGCSSESDGGAPAVSVTALVKAHLELKLINPKLDMLDKAFKEDHVIADILSADGDDRGRHQLPAGETWESLRDRVQASDGEISKSLEDMDVVRVDGKWMGVSPESYSSFVKLVLLTATERGWQLDRVPSVEMALALEEHGVCGQVTLQLLRNLQVKGSGNAFTVEDVDRRDWRELPKPLGSCALDLPAVCKHVAIGILLEKDIWEDANEFLASWRALLPESVVPTLEMLRGECIELETEVLGEMGTKTMRKSVSRLSVGDLPRDVSRFEHLWKAKSAWQLEEILPYIDQLSAPGQNTEELLLKHSRPSQTRPEDPVLYTKR
jgi:sister chromatid cohesion protein DCC1